MYQGSSIVYTYMFFARVPSVYIDSLSSVSNERVSSAALFRKLSDVNDISVTWWSGGVDSLYMLARTMTTEKCERVEGRGLRLVTAQLCT